MDVRGVRIAWDGEPEPLVALEPRPDEVAAHAAALAAGYNEPGNAALMGHTEPISEAEVTGVYDQMFADGARPFLLFAGGALVGDADLRELADGAAGFAFMIASRARQGRGLGTRFAIMIHALAFAQLGLEHVYAAVVPDNTASRRVFEKLGYTSDDGPAARAYADEPGDVTLAIDRATFERRHAGALAQIRIAARVPHPAG